MQPPSVPQPDLRVTSVTIGSPQPRQLARFYAGLLGWPLTADDPPREGMPDRDGWAQIQPPPGRVGPTLNFEYEARFRRPVWPAEEGQQTASQHLGIQVDDLAAAVAWAERRGARQAQTQPQHDVRVMIDPDGHPF